MEVRFHPATPNPSTTPLTPHSPSDFKLNVLHRFGVTEDQIMNKIMNSNYRELIKFEIARARKYFDRAEEGIKMLSPDARLPVRTFCIYIYIYVLYIYMCVQSGGDDPWVDPWVEMEWIETRRDGMTDPLIPTHPQVRSSLDMYRKILNVIEENDYDNFRKVRDGLAADNHTRRTHKREGRAPLLGIDIMSWHTHHHACLHMVQRMASHPHPTPKLQPTQRAYVGKFEKLLTLPYSWLKTLSG